MSEELKLAPTTDVNGSPEVMSTLMELSPEIAAEIMELVGGIEQYKNIRLGRQKLFSLSDEDFENKNILTRLIDTLIRFIKRFFEDIYEGTATLSFSLGRIHNRAELINTESRSRGRTNRKDSFNITTRIQNLCVNYRPIADPQQLFTLLKSTDVIFKQYFKYQNVDLSNAVPNIITIRPEDESSIIRLAEILSPLSPISKAKEWNLSGDDSVRSSAHLFGNQRLHAYSKYTNGDLVERITGQEWLIKPSSDNPRGLPEGITYKVFAKTIEQSILREIISTTADLESNFGIISRNRRSIRTQDIIRYLDYLRNNLMTGRYTGEVEKRANQIVSMLEAYSAWMVNPYLNMMSLYIRNVNAILNVCEGNN